MAVGLVGFGLDVAPLLVGFPAALVVLALGSFVPALKREVAHHPPKHRRDTLAWRWSRIIQHRPWTAALAGAAVLLALSAPVLGLRLSSSRLGRALSEESVPVPPTRATRVGATGSLRCHRPANRTP